MRRGAARKRLNFSLTVVGMTLFFSGFRAFALTEGDYTYDVSDGGAIITGFAPSSGGALTIPNTLGGFPVTAIGYGVFADQHGLTSVVIPESVTSIGGGAFSGCTSLTRITLPASLDTIAEGAFQGCSSLNGSITIPADVTSIGFIAFMGCTNLKAINVNRRNACYCSVKGVLYDAGLTMLIQCPGGKTGTCAIPAGVTTIVEYALAGCARLTDVTIPDGVVTIGYAAFSDCTGLTRISVPSSVIRIDCCAFWGCSGLTSVTLAEGVGGIDALVFNNCTGLTRVTIPASVSGIGGGAFSGCTGLTGLYFKGTPPWTLYNIWDDESGTETPPCCYHLVDASGWGPAFSGCPAAVWTTAAVFNAMGGSSSFADRTYNVGATYGELPTAERSGCAFGGWWTMPNGLGVKVSESTLVPYLYTGHTLYAKWSRLRARDNR